MIKALPGTQSRTSRPFDIIFGFHLPPLTVENGAGRSYICMAVVVNGERRNRHAEEGSTPGAQV